MQILNIGNYVVKNYLIETEKGVIAIDTGYPGGADTFVRRFEKHWPLSQLKYIFITHHHDDHVGFLGDLLKRCDSKVIVNPLTLKLLKQGENQQPAGSGYSSLPGSLYGKFKKEFRFPPIDLSGRAVVIRDEADPFFERLGLPIKIVFLPGHTSDSMGLFLPETGQLFCGDAAMNAVISVAKHTIWIEDPVKFGQSWDKMLSIKPDRIYPSHGTPFSPRALIKYRHYLDSRQLRPMK